MKLDWFWAGVAVVLIAGFAFTRIVENEYYYVFTYTILQYMIMAVAWNILGGFTGYVNFGSAGFFAVGVYTSLALHKALDLPLPLLILASGCASALLGLAAGYLTLRLKGVYFAIATLAAALVIETFANNWEYVGGAAGTYVIWQGNTLIFENHFELLFMVMLVLGVAAVAASRHLSTSRLGQGLSAIRDDELAAECSGVPTLRLKLISTTTMGFFMGVAGAPFPFFISFVDPLSAFGLLIAVNAIAMPVIGGTSVWYGPVIGVLLLGSIQEWATVTISSEFNLLIVGVMLVFFITLAPQGIVGLAQMVRRRVNG